MASSILTSESAEEVATPIAVSVGVTSLLPIPATAPAENHIATISNNSPTTSNTGNVISTNSSSNSNSCATNIHANGNTNFTQITNANSTVAALTISINSNINVNVSTNTNVNANNTNTTNINANANTNANTSANTNSTSAIAKLTDEKPLTADVASVVKTYNEFIKEPNAIDESANYILDQLVEDAVVGVFLEVHHLRKSGNLDAMEGVPEDETEKSLRIVNQPNYDIFGTSTAKKPMDCNCPNCDRPVSAARFAPHLEKCMGMGRISSRIASRRLATKDGNSASSSSSSSYVQTNAGTDDEDDVDWPSEKRRKKVSQSARNNGSKKNNGKTNF